MVSSYITHRICELNTWEYRCSCLSPFADLSASCVCRLNISTTCNVSMWMHMQASLLLTVLLPVVVKKSECHDELLRLRTETPGLYEPLQKVCCLVVLRRSWTQPQNIEEQPYNWKPFPGLWQSSIWQTRRYRTCVLWMRTLIYCFMWTKVPSNLFIICEFAHRPKQALSTNQTGWSSSYLGVSTIVLDKAEDGCPLILMAPYCVTMIRVLLQVADTHRVLHLVFRPPPSSTVCVSACVYAHLQLWLPQSKSYSRPQLAHI